MRAYSLAIAVLLTLSGTWCHAQELLFPTFGVKVTSPDGMVRIPPGNMSHVARWAQLDEAGRPLAMVTLEVQPANGRSVEQWAGGAGGVGADVRAEPSKLGEYDATRFTKLAHPSELHLANIYACRHGAYLWMAASYTSAASPDAPGMETLRQSIVFTEPDPPANKWAKSLGRKYGMASPPRWHRLEGTVDKVIAEPIMGKADGNGASVRMVHGLAQIDAEHTVLVICTISAERAYQAAAERIIASVTGDSAR